MCDLGVLSNSQVFIYWSNISVDIFFNVKSNKSLNWCGYKRNLWKFSLHSLKCILIFFYDFFFRRTCFLALFSFYLLLWESYGQRCDHSTLSQSDKANVLSFFLSDCKNNYLASARQINWDLRNKWTLPLGVVSLTLELRTTSHTG